MKKYSTEIANAVRDFLMSDDWNFRFNEAKGIFTFGLSLKGKLSQLSYVICIKTDEVIVYANSPIGVDSEDEATMTCMARFLSRANFGLRNGCFELDLQHGEIRYRTYIDCGGELPNQKAIKRCIYIPVSMYRRYAEGVMAILFQGATDQEAIDLCENSEQEARRLMSLLEELGSRRGSAEDSEDAGEASVSSEARAMLARMAARFASAGGAEDSEDAGEEEASGGTEEEVTFTELFSDEEEGEDGTC